jgi:hypothetical protein
MLHLQNRQSLALLLEPSKELNPLLLGDNLLPKPDHLALA